MADPGDEHLRAFDPARRHRRRDRHPLGPAGALGVAAQPAVEEARRAAVRDAARAGIGIEEALAVEMVRGRAFMIDPVEEGRDQRRREAQGDEEEEERRAEAAEPGSHRGLLEAVGSNWKHRSG